jgi:hypothetical protein
VDIEDGLRRNLGRVEKTPGGQLALAPAAEAARHQRAGRHDLPRYDVSAPIEADISFQTRRV